MPRSPTQPEPPEFFVDRSLGRHLLPDALQQSGFTAHTLASVYGEDEAQKTKDEVWLQVAGEREWVVLTKDDAIRRRPAELAAVEEHAVKMFCLTNANLRGQQQRERFLANCADPLVVVHLLCESVAPRWGEGGPRHGQATAAYA